MIKKLGLLILAVSLSFGASNQDVINFLTKRIPPQILKSLTIKVVKRDKIDGSKMEAVTLEIKNQKRVNKLVLFTDGKFK